MITLHGGADGVVEFPTLVRRTFTLEGSRLVGVWEECLVLETETQPRYLVIVNSNGIERNRSASRDVRFSRFVGVWEGMAVMNTSTDGGEPDGVVALSRSGERMNVRGINYCSYVWRRWCIAFSYSGIELWEREEGGSTEIQLVMVRGLEVGGAPVSALGLSNSLLIGTWGEGI